MNVWHWCSNWFWLLWANEDWKHLFNGRKGSKFVSAGNSSPKFHHRVCASVCLCVYHVYGWIPLLPFPPFVCKSTRSEVDKWNQLLVLHHFFWLMLGQHGLWQPFAHWCPCEISFLTAFLISWGSFSSFQKLIGYRVKMMFPSSFWVERCYQTPCWTNAQAGALRPWDAGHSSVKESKACATSLCVSWMFKASA